MVVDRTTKIGDILDFNRETSVYFLEMGMHCLGCPSARNETIEQACLVHGVSVEDLIARINEHLSK